MHDLLERLYCLNPFWALAGEPKSKAPSRAMVTVIVNRFFMI